MVTRRKRIIVILEAIFTVIVWGGSFIATKLALRDISPVTVVWLRFAMGVPILGAAVALRRQIAMPSGKDLLYFTGLGFLGITFHQWLQSTGLQTSQAATTAWIVASTPIFIAVLGSLFLKEKLRWLRLAGILLATTGVLLVVSKGDFGTLLAGQFGLPGDRLILISAPNWAIFSVASRYGLTRHPAARMMFFVMLFGWLFTTVQFSLQMGFSEITQITTQGWLAIAFLGVFCSGLAYVFWYDALEALPASQAGAFLYIEPLVAMVVAALVLGESIVGAMALGGAVILIGVWMVNRQA